MKAPSLQTALEAIAALGQLGTAIDAATPMVGIIVDLFDGEPADQDAVKAKVRETYASAGAALDALDAAIAAARQ